MTKLKAFISFDSNNNEEQKSFFVGQCKHSIASLNVVGWSSKERLAQTRREKVVEEMMKQCNMVIVLVGRSMGIAYGVSKEIVLAKKNNLPFFGVYVDGASASSTLPEGLLRSKVVPWTWDGIADMIDQVLNEGKNGIV